MTPKEYVRYLRKYYKIKRRKATRWYADTTTKTVYGPPWKTDVNSFLAELHEIAHCVLEHDDDTYLSKTLKCEIDAWIWALYHAFTITNIPLSAILKIVKCLTDYKNTRIIKDS